MAGRPAADLVRLALRAALARIQAAVQAASEGDVEGIHRLRTTTRRLRNELKVMRRLVDREWRTHLEAELKWLARVLGEVRDLDVLRHRLLGSPESEGATGTEDGRAPVLRPLLDSLRVRHLGLSGALRDALKSERYHALVAEIEASAEHPRLKRRARKACREVLPALGRAAWKPLKKTARDLRPNDPDESFHRVRKLAKRARYTAELIAPALDPKDENRAGRFLRLVTELQDALGEHQDAVVARAEVEQTLTSRPLDEEFRHAARALLEEQKQAIRAARDRFSDAWTRLDRKRSLRWLKWRNTARP